MLWMVPTGCTALHISARASRPTSTRTYDKGPVARETLAPGWQTDGIHRLVDLDRPVRLNHGDVVLVAGGVVPGVGPDLLHPIHSILGLATGVKVVLADLQRDLVLSETLRKMRREEES